MWSPEHNKQLLCRELNKIINSYPTLSVNDLIAGCSNSQCAYNKAITVTTEIIKSGNISGSVARVNDNNMFVTMSIYQWDKVNREHRLIRTMLAKFGETRMKVEWFKDDKSISRIVVGCYFKEFELAGKGYLYLDLDGNAYDFAVNVRMLI